MEYLHLANVEKDIDYIGQVMKMPELQNILEQYGKQYKEKH